MSEFYRSGCKVAEVFRGRLKYYYLINEVWDFLSSGFFTTIFGAGAATWMGARAAESVANAKADQDEQLRELRNINFAITLSFSVVNLLLSFKKQNVQGLVEEFIASRSDFSTQLALARLATTGPTPQVRVQGNFVRIQPPELSLTALEAILIEKISVRTRPLAAFLALREATVNLRNAVSIRQEVMDEYKLAGQYSPFDYYGLKQGSREDRRYFDSMIGIRSYLDDGIYFSKLLCEDLQKYGHEREKQFYKIFKKSPLKISNLNFAPAIGQGLLPFGDEYKSWLSSFQTPPSDLRTITRVYLRLKLFFLLSKPLWNGWIVLDGLLIIASAASLLSSI